jgi:hypothetical protein
MPAPTIDTKKARGPGNLPGAASIGNRLTGPTLFMKNTALDAFIAFSWNGLFAEAVRCAEHHLMG